MDLCDLKIYYILPYYVHPSPVKAKQGSARPPGQCSTLLQNGAVIKSIPTLSYHPFNLANSFMTEDQQKVRGLVVAAQPGC